MKHFFVDIPDAHVSEVRRKLAASQRHKAAQDQVRYSTGHKAFWRWTRTPKGSWRMQECSRDGRRLGQFIGRIWDDVLFTTTPSGEKIARPVNWAQSGAQGGGANSRLVYVKTPVRGDQWLPDFLPKGHRLKEIGAVTGRWSPTCPPLTPEKPTMNPLKLAILCHRQLFAGTDFTTPPGLVSTGSIMDANSELVRDGLVELGVRGYTVTDKGRVYLEHLFAQPYPVVSKPQWIMPKA